LNDLKSKIDKSSKDLKNFDLLYLKARLFLINRVIETRKVVNKSSETSENSTGLIQTSEQVTFSKSKASHKRSSIDKFIGFFKPDSKQVAETLFVVQKNSEIEPKSSITLSKANHLYANFHRRMSSAVNLPTSDEMEGEEGKRFEINSSNNGTFGNKQRNPTLIDNSDVFYQIEDDWNNSQTRNVAYTAVIFDEFVKEMAAICQEHSVLN
jgi:hypothetical protein